MGMLAEKTSHFDVVKAAVTPALKYFDNSKINDQTKKQISDAADIAFSDELLLEKFQMWNSEKDDEFFLFHISRFFENQHIKPLSKSEQDLTAQRGHIEENQKEEVRTQQKKIFGERVTRLATEHNLLTNDSLGDFLEVSGEQARKFKAGENKPQLTTLKKVADRFSVSVEYLVGLSDQK
jgi:hypothetical protein